MSPAIAEVVMAAVRAAEQMGHGGKGEIYEKARLQLGISPAQFYRYRKELTVELKTRKQRKDAGQSWLTREEALTISGVLMETLRKNNRQMGSLVQMVKALRKDGKIRAERLDKNTGELIPLSESAISRALRSYGLHPDQLLQPTGHSTMGSLHPNHVWQIDASLCVLYYLKPNKRTGNGLHVMERDKFYKNKPANLKKIMADRVWSYEITDHTTGWLYVEYVMGAESGENLCSVLINAMQERGGADLMHGVPKVLYMDPGSANTSAMAKNLCKALKIDAIAHAPGNARATGQVENARKLIEEHFEFGLKFRPVADLEELNKLAVQWRSVWNASQKHRRHGLTRSEAWLKIKEHELVKAPTVEECRSLAISGPVERKVNAGHYGHYISLDGEDYDVSHLDIETGQKIQVARNPLGNKTAYALMLDENGHEIRHELALIVKNEWGFPVEGPILGESFKAPAETTGQKARKEIEQLMTETDSVTDAEQARKKKAIPMGGSFDPYKGLDDAKLPTYMPRKGTEHGLKMPSVEAQLLTTTQIAMRLRSRMGADWKPEFFAWLEQRHPDGVQESQLGSLEEQLRKPHAMALKVINGG
ncbi:DDE-type integrase/transposase/recombinase [Oceanospirillum beijerinckii]|uniref:DDE-type integrase/transposase/recombinase n=1 Tax=Oceanospirillum beijerinckii TaxID=64976 RepID=UPI00048284D3|nr:DDE-type integrase/transposase/recombinase [Oceanospirillum beijerinckii]